VEPKDNERCFARVFVKTSLLYVEIGSKCSVDHLKDYTHRTHIIHEGSYFFCDFFPQFFELRKNTGVWGRAYPYLISLSTNCLQRGIDREAPRA